MNQEFTVKEFSYLVRRGDYFTYFISNNKEEKIEDLKKEMLQYVVDNWNSCSNLFSTLKMISLKRKNTYIFEKIKKDNSNLKQRLIDDFILRKVNKNLKKFMEYINQIDIKLLKTSKTYYLRIYPFISVKQILNISMNL